MKKGRRSNIRILWFLGSIFGFTGAIIGLILPIIPHMPFLIFGAFCLSKLSAKVRRFLLQKLQSPWGQKFAQPVVDYLLKYKVVRKLVKL